MAKKVALASAASALASSVLPLPGARGARRNQARRGLFLVDSVEWVGFISINARRRESCAAPAATPGSRAHSWSKRFSRS